MYAEVSTSHEALSQQWQHCGGIEPTMGQHCGGTEPTLHSPVV